MSERPLESLKDSANQLAHLIAHKSKDREKVHAFKQKLGLNSPTLKTGNIHPLPPVKEKEDTEYGEKVGIWVPKLYNGKKYYIRDSKYQKEFLYWGRVHKIPPRSSKKRIIYFGESVSRGYLLEPFYTPASVLENLLNSEPTLLQTEIIDLARTDCSIELLKKLCSSSLAMKPDAFIIFAGNNWLRSIELSEDLKDEIMKVMDIEERFTGFRRILENRYREVAASFMKYINDLSKEHNIPVVFMIPANNLVDFHSNPVQRANLFPAGETGRWLILKEKGERLLKKGDIEKAELLIREMIKLNEGNPYGFELLARCKLKRGMFSEVAECLLMAIDTAMFRGQNVPCCISIIRETLLEESAKYKIPVVDLPEVFERYQSNKLPGRELFLDYCHLTAEGIQVAMAEAAQKLFSVLTQHEISTDALRAIAPKPGSDVTARSHFFAAVHNAHRGEQPYEILFYHCLKALNESDTVKELMLNYVEMASHCTVWALSKWCGKLFESGEIEQFPHILQPHNHYIMDIKLVDAIVDALKQHGIDVKDRVSNLRKKEYGFKNGKINLLDSYYHLTSYIVSYRLNDSYYRAFTPQSCFYLVAEEHDRVKLKLTYRLPAHSPKEGKLYMKVNNTDAAEFPASDRWKDFSLTIPGKLLEDGINTITIQWPPDIDHREVNKDIRIPENTSELFVHKMLPSYGEIFTFTAERM